MGFTEINAEEKVNNNTPIAGGSIVHLICKSTGKSLRIMEDGSVEGKGRRGKRAQFELLRCGDSENHIKLRNVNNPKRFLRINEEQQLDGLGCGGKWTEFQMIKMGTTPEGNDEIVLRSNAHLPEELHVGILPDGTPKRPRSTKMGPAARFVLIQKENKNKNKNKGKEVSNEIVIKAENESKEQTRQASKEKDQISNNNKGKKAMKLEWLACVDGKLPKEKKVKVDKNVPKSFVCRAFMDGQWVAAQFSPRDRVAHFTWAGADCTSTNFQVLCKIFE